MPFAPGAEEACLDHVDHVDVLFQQRTKLLHMREHDIVAGLAAAGHTPLIGKAHIELNAQLLCAVKNLLHPLHAVVVDLVFVFISREVEIHLTELGTVRGILLDKAADVHRWILLRRMTVIHGIADIDIGLAAPRTVRVVV